MKKIVQMKEDIKKRILKWFWGLFCFPIVLVITLIGLVWTFADIPSFEELENPNNRFASEVYFADCPVMNKYFEKENRKYTEFQEIPTHVIDALIATEDVRFYEHSGVDVRGLFRVIK